MGKAKEALDYNALQKIINKRREELGIKVDPSNYGKWEYKLQKKRGVNLMKELGI